MLPLQREHGFTAFSCSKINDFCIICSLVFGVFSKPLPEAPFGGPKRRSVNKNAICVGIWAPAGPQNDPSECHFPPKSGPKSIPPNDRARHKADLGAIWRRKRSKDTV